MAEKYFSRAISSQVTLAKGPHDIGFACDIIAHVMQGVVLKGSAGAQEAHFAFDRAADRIEKQLRRYTSRLKARKATGMNGNAVDLNARSDEHTSELQSLMRIPYAVFCLNKNTK